VLDWFDFLANPDDAATKPNRLKTEYGGTSGNSHPNSAANKLSTDVFAVQRDNFFDIAWDDFRGADRDGDRMGDWWERAHGLDPSAPGDASANLDGDRFDNLGEYTADTDPTDPSDWFHIHSIDNIPSVVLRFVSSPERIYTMESSPDLSEASWTPVPGAGPRPGAGGEDSMQDTNTPPRGPFYRIRVAVP
jgi:hypothetical protein